MEEVEASIIGYSSLSEEAKDVLTDKEIEKGVITKCVRKLKNNKTDSSDGLVDGLLKYGGLGMVHLLQELFSVIWHEKLQEKLFAELVFNINCLQKIVCQQN